MPPLCLRIRVCSAPRFNQQEYHVTTALTSVGYGLSYPLTYPYITQDYVPLVPVLVPLSTG